MEQWLTDFFTVVGNDPRFVGHFSIGGGGLDKNSETYRNAIPPAEIAAMLLARAKHDKRSATFFEAVFERENTTRDDFIDRITARVKPDRRVFVEYRTYEKESICTHTKNGKPARFSSTSPLVIGVSHEATNLKLTSDIFPHGFAERKPKDFRVRFVNQSENTCRYEDWPNRQQTRQ